MPGAKLQCANPGCTEKHSNFVLTTNCHQEHDPHYFHFSCLTTLVFQTDLIYCPYCCNDLTPWALSNKKAILNCTNDPEKIEAYLHLFDTWATFTKPPIARKYDLKWIQIRRRYNSP